MLIWQHWLYINSAPDQFNTNSWVTQIFMLKRISFWDPEIDCYGPFKHDEPNMLLTTPMTKNWESKSSSSNELFALQVNI